MTYKNIFATLLLIFIIGGCKKGNDSSTQPQHPLPDISGNWMLSDVKITTSLSSVEYNATDFPCMLNNIMSINNKGITKGFYTGSNECFLYKDPSQNGTFAIGVPGEDTIYGTWANKGGELIFKNIYSTGNISYSYPKIASVDGKLQLIQPDTLGADKSFIEIATYIKQ